MYVFTLNLQCSNTENLLFSTETKLKTMQNNVSKTCSSMKEIHHLASFLNPVMSQVWIHTSNRGELSLGITSRQQHMQDVTALRESSGLDQEQLGGDQIFL